MSEITEQVGRMIRNARKEKGLTQQELAERLGIGTATVNRYETGRQNLTIETLQKVANAIGTEITLVVK